MTVYTGTRCRRRQLQRTEFAGGLDGSWWLAASHSCVTVVTTSHQGGRKLTSLAPCFAEVAVQGAGQAPAHDGGLVRVAVDEPEQLHLLLATSGGEAQSRKPDESKSGRRWIFTVQQDAEQSYCVANAPGAFAHASGSGGGERARELEVAERYISHAYGDVTRWVNDPQPGPAWRRRLPVKAGCLGRRTGRRLAARVVTVRLDARLLGGGVCGRRARSIPSLLGNGCGVIRRRRTDRAKRLG